jgi:gluconate 5-dehydrogenase
VNAKKLFDLSGRVAIVTGGSIGLGRQMAEGLAELGANLVLCSRKKERCEQAAEELNRLGVQTLAVACDVKNPDQDRAVVEGAIAQFGRQCGNILGRSG